MKVFISNPPWIVDGKKGVRAGSRWPHLKIEEEGNYMPFPFFLSYAAAVLTENNIDISFCDAIAEDISINTFLKRLQSDNANVFVMETSTPSINYDIHVIKKIREFYKGMVIICGPEGNIYNEDFLNNHKDIDFVLVGEYEYTLLDLVQCLKNNLPYNDVKGIIYRNKEGLAIKNGKRDLINNLDELPWLYRKGLKMESYDDRPGGIPAPSVQMWASRGCPFRCSFCNWPQLMYGGNKYRTRNVTDIVDEMEMLKKQGFKSVYFDDDTFNIGKNRMLEFACELKKRNLNLPYAIMARADLMDWEILSELHCSGLKAVKYGIESGVQELIDGINKSLDLEAAKSMVLATKELGIFTHLTFTFGLPGETLETIEKTIQFALDLDADSVQFSITTPFPGTEFHKEMSDKNFLISDKNADFDGNYGSPIRTVSLSPDDLVNARNNAYERWKKHKERKFLNNNLDLVGVFNKKKAFKGPYHVQIDLTNECNSNCIACWCNSPLLGKDILKRRDTLSFPVVKKLIEDVSGMGTKEIYLAGGGEPFMHPRIIEILKLIKSKGMICHINTNFTLVTEEIARQIIEIGVDHIIISLWAASEKTYKETHPGLPDSKFQKIIDVIKYIQSHKNKAPYVKLYNVMFTHNYFEFDKMVKLAQELQVDATEFTVVDTIPGKTDVLLLSRGMKDYILNKIGFLKENIPYDYEWDEGNYIFHFDRQKCIKLFKLEHFIRRLLNKDSETSNYDSDIIQKIPCYIGWLSSRILADGNMNACLKAHRIPVGNINKNSFSEIWNGKKMREFRKAALNIEKTDPLFSKIGNDPDAGIGCFKGCDDITRNIMCHNRILALNKKERMILKDEAEKNK